MAERNNAKADGASSSGDGGQRPQPQSAAAGIKETIESIVVAFILAFIFRAFVVEAFVIPTGSMATTLLGAHMRFHCPDCGYQFDVNYSPRSGDGDEIDIPNVATPLTYPIYCPNCGFDVLPPRSKAQPPVHYGDRILVLKYLYLFEKPQRWDVVVFKSPADPKFSQNYIKRLVGNPGETLMILDGDIYKQIGSSGWQVQTKPRAVQESMWRVVYDNDYLPQRLPRDSGPAWRQPWDQAEGDGWKVDRRTFEFSNTQGSGTLRFDPETNSGGQQLSDYLAYDQPMAYRGRGFNNTISDRQETPVSDLKLQLFYQRKSGAGPLRLSLAKNDETFTAEITPQSARLLKTTGGQNAQIGEAVALAAAGSLPLQIELTNVDYRVTLRLNGQDVIATTPRDYAPNVQQLMDDHDKSRRSRPGVVSISAERQACELSHVGLWRDVYYTNSAGSSRELWGSPTKPVALGPDEYFVMGDNTLISGDARVWDSPVNLPDEGLINVQSGRVPGRFMLGKAFFVYWPAGFRPFSDTNPGIVPNFGDMRFIH